MKLRTQSLLFLILGLGSLAATASIITSQFKRTQQLADSVQQHQQALVLVNTYQLSANNLVLYSIELIRSGDISGERIVSYKMAAASLERATNELKKLAEFTPNYSKEYNRMIKQGEDLSQLCADKLIAPLYNNQTVEKAMIDRLIYTELDDIFRSCNFMRNNINEDLRSLNSLQEQKNFTVNRIYLPATLASVTIILIFSILLIFRITAVVNTTRKRMQELAMGDSSLDITLPVKGSNEMSLLCKNFNHLMKNLKERSHSINSIAGEHMESGNRLMAVTEDHGSALIQIEQNLEGINNICANLTQKVFSSTEEITQISSALDQLEGKAGDQEKQTVTIHHQGVGILNALSSQEQAMEEQIRLTHRVQEEGEQNQEILRMLKKQINDIIMESSTLSKSVIDIQDLAEQTDLLAVNASIQAARAGDVGKKFSVVTREMHTLSSKVRNITTGLTGLIKNLQSRLKLMAEEEQQNRNSIDRLMSQNKKAEKSIHLIHGTMEDIEKRVTRFMETLKDLRDGSTLIHLQSDQVRKNGNTLTLNMKDLEELQTSIRLELKEITMGIKQLNHGTMTLKELSQNNHNSARALGSEIRMMGG